MAILQGLLALLARQAGRLLNTAFGWATTMLFGKVPEKRQIYLSVIAFGSVIWLVTLLGIAFPAFGTFLLAFIPLPEWVDETWVRVAMLVAAILTPLIVGFIALRLLDPQERPQATTAKAKTILKGYPYTLGLALTLIMMTIFAPVLRIQTLARRWATQHVPVMVESQDYSEVVGEIQEALRNRGWSTERYQATWMLRVPTKVLTLLAGGAIENFVANELTTLKGEGLEVLLHPSDLVISGKEADVVHARATVVEQLAFSKAYMTWTEEANELEDRIEALWDETRRTMANSVPEEAWATLDALERDLRTLEIPYEEWEVLYREKQQVENRLLQVAAGLTDRPHEPADADSKRGEQGQNQTGWLVQRRELVPQLGALVLFVLLAWLSREARRGAY